MSTDRKIRCDATLLNEADDFQQELFSQMRHGMGYDEAKVWTKKKLGYRPSDGSLNHFWKHWSKKFNENRVLKAVTSAKDIQRTAAEHLPLLGDAAITALTQAAFEAASSNDGDAAKTFMSLVLQAKAQDLQQQRLNFDRDRFRNSIKEEQDKALDALYEDIAGNPAAEELFERLREAVSYAREVAE